MGIAISYKLYLQPSTRFGISLPNGIRKKIRPTVTPKAENRSVPLHWCRMGPRKLLRFKEGGFGILKRLRGISQPQNILVTYVPCLGFAAAWCVKYVSFWPQVSDWNLSRSYFQIVNYCVLLKRTGFIAVYCYHLKSNIFGEPKLSLANRWEKERHEWI